jgi:hypothetical protein
VKYSFKELPGRSEDYLRPVVPIEVEGLARAPQLCLLDTGALHNRFGAWLAEAAGIDLSEGQIDHIALAGFATSARSATVQLTLGDTSWDTTVWFCDPWPLSFHLLGQEGFFRWFDVRIRAAREQLDITEVH